MPDFVGRNIVGVYVCPSGVFAVECRRVSGALEIGRTFDVSARRLASAADAAERVTRLLRSAAIENARVMISIRGFGVVSHVLQVPASSDDVGALVEREMGRLDQLEGSLVAWQRLPSSPLAEAADAGSAVLAVAAPRETVAAFSSALAGLGHELAHMTPLAAAMTRLVEQLAPPPPDEVLAVGAALPDGLYLGFLLGGALRLESEPAFEPRLAPDASALAEEMELGAVLLTQQFAGVRVGRIAIVGADDAAEGVLRERLKVPASRVTLRDVNAGALAAFGAVLDALSTAPLSIGGTSFERAAAKSRRRWLVAALLVALVGLLFVAWKAAGILESRRTAGATTTAARSPTTSAPVPAVPRRIEQDSTAPPNVAVAPHADSPTVGSTVARHRLTSLTIADDRRAAVVDDRRVTVGDVLSDGSRISAIQSNGVWLVEKTGTWRFMPLPRRR